jgi:hypothetical protein
MTTSTKVKWGLVAVGVAIAWIWGATPNCEDVSGIIYAGCLSQQPLDPTCRQTQLCMDHFGHQWYVTTYADGTVDKTERTYST